MNNFEIKKQKKQKKSYSIKSLMARKFMRKLMKVIIDLIVIILVKVQANELISTPFHPSSHRIMFPHPAKNDFQICLDEAIVVCEVKRKNRGCLWFCDLLI